MTTAATPQSGYGNYIDEALLMKTPSQTYYYGHDQLYSPVILVNSSGSIEDRYEYDAYGTCRVLNADFTADADGKPDCGNPYLFTGREVDYLDNGSHPLQYNRHRYYLQGIGRWTSEDPLGVDPAGKLSGNPFGVIRQQANAHSLYQYALCIPTLRMDPSGLIAVVRGVGDWACYPNAKQAIAAADKALQQPTCRDWFVKARGGKGMADVFTVSTGSKWGGAWEKLKVSSTFISDVTTP